MRTAHDAAVDYLEHPTPETHQAAVDAVRDAHLDNGYSEGDLAGLDMTALTDAYIEKLVRSAGLPTGVAS